MRTPTVYRFVGSPTTIDRILLNQTISAAGFQHNSDPTSFCQFKKWVSDETQTQTAEILREMQIKKLY
jgi:hypothetical protein